MKLKTAVETVELPPALAALTAARVGDDLEAGLAALQITRDECRRQCQEAEDAITERTRERNRIEGERVHRLANLDSTESIIASLRRGIELDEDAIRLGVEAFEAQRAHVGALSSLTFVAMLDSVREIPSHDLAIRLAKDLIAKLEAKRAALAE